MFKSMFNKRGPTSSSDYYPSIVLAVKEVLDSDYNGQEITRQTKLVDLGMDSIKYINLLLKLSELIATDIEVIVGGVDLGSIESMDDLNNVLIRLNGRK